MAPRRPAKPDARSSRHAARTAFRDTDKIDEEDVQAAVSIINRDYMDDVRGVADDLKRAIKDGEIDSPTDADEWLHQTLDGHARVIYTFQSKLGLISSDNADAAVEDTGEVPMQNGEINWAAMMYYAMATDVRDYLGDFDDLFEEED